MRIRQTMPPLQFGGYTLIELLITISITGILIVFGLSGYSKNQERQIALSAKESIIAILQEAQTQATIGENDCSGIFQGVRVTLTNSTVTKTPVCAGGDGTAKETIIPSVTFSNSYSLIFLPLGNGVNLGGASSLNIDYSVDDLSYQININSPGVITYNGKQS